MSKARNTSAERLEAYLSKKNCIFDRNMLYMCKLKYWVSERSIWTKEGKELYA